MKIVQRNRTNTDRQPFTLKSLKKKTFENITVDRYCKNSQ